MKRRQFIFRTIKSASLLSPVLSMRLSYAQASQRKVKSLFFVDGGSYPFAEDFFPATTGTDFNLPVMLAGFEDLKQDLVIVDGINIRDSGDTPRGNNHVRAMGKVLTASDVTTISGTEDGMPGGISVDQFIASSQQVNSLEVQINDSLRGDMRGKPFALGKNQFKTPIQDVAAAWDKIFRGFNPEVQAKADPAAVEQRLQYLLKEKSLLDDITSELKRFRAELGGLEKLKLDMHEDAIRRSERSVSEAIKETQGGNVSFLSQCSIPERVAASNIPAVAKAHMDILYAAFVCDLIGVGSVMFGYSSQSWKYDWIGLDVDDNMHDDVYHKRDNRREDHIKAAQWDLGHAADLARRLKNTPDGSSNMLDNMLFYVTSHFGEHHKLERIPVMLIGKAGGQLETGRSIKLTGAHTNAKSLASAASLCGVAVNGFGDEPESGLIPGL